MIPAHALEVGVFGWLIGCAAIAVLAVGSMLLGCLFGSSKVDEALAQLEDDEPVPYLPAGRCEPCSCGECEKAKAAARARIRARLAELVRIDWTAETDAELQRIADGGR